MAYAIELDRQPRTRTIEIQDIRADRMLPAENRLARFTSSQAIPQPNLRRRHPAPKILRDSDCSCWRSHLPNLMRPLHHASHGPPPPLSRGRKQSATQFTYAYPPTM